MTKKEAAKTLFFQGVKQGEISKLLTVAEQTVSRWKKNEAWAEKRATHVLAQETATESVWELINYQLKALRSLKDQFEDEVQKGGKYTLIGKGEIDALQKLFAAVKGKQLTWTNYVQILREFVKYLQESNLDIAKRILDIVDEFLNQKRKDL